MNKNAIKDVGKMKEQIDTESKARRNYPHKWGKFYNETPWNDMYHPSRLSKQLQDQMNVEDLNPYKYKNEAEGYFVSPGMHEALLAKCRCGRPRSDVHLLRCLQNQQDKYEIKENGEERNDEKNDKKFTLPQTSSKFVGWKKSKPKYQQWENAMKYISPVYDMPGERITTTPYNVIYIG